jgi:AcrR family transcriptional regulator
MEDDRTEDTYDRVVELYMSGARLKDITAETGVPRPTIYYALRKRGLTPTRTKASDETITVSDVLQQLAAANREIGRLQARLEQLEGGIT